MSAQSRTITCVEESYRSVALSGVSDRLRHLDMLLASLPCSRTMSLMKGLCWSNLVMLLGFSDELIMYYLKDG